MVVEQRVRSSPRKPSKRQTSITTQAVRWYVENHHGTPTDQGVTRTFCDPARVGAFAVTLEGVARRDSAELFRLIVAVAMFQRRQDAQIIRILGGMTEADSAEVSSMQRLLALASRSECEHTKTLDGLLSSCDLTKTPKTKRGSCRANTSVQCHLKRHTVLLRRYGHFGKVPTSIALAVRESGEVDISAMLDAAAAREATPNARARAMIAALSRAWRVSEKISSMFLAMVWNPDLTPGVTERDDVDWRHFIVIDSNTDLFLSSIGYDGLGTYEARRAFIRAISKEVDLSALHPALRRDNPRIIQQAMYLFMSESNRRGIPTDCMRRRSEACPRCPSVLRSRCPVGDRAKRRLSVVT